MEACRSDRPEIAAKRRSGVKAATKQAHWHGLQVIIDLHATSIRAVESIVMSRSG